MQKNQAGLDFSFARCTKTNSKQIKDLNVTSEIIKVLKENIGIMLFHVSLSCIVLFCFSAKSSQEWETKAKVYRWNYFKLK